MATRPELNLKGALHSVPVNCKYQVISFFKSLLLELLRRNICWYFQHTLAFSRGHDCACSTNAYLNRLIHTQTHTIIENVSCIAVPQHRVLAGYTSASECFSSPLCSCSSAPFLINGLDKLACSEEMK